MTTRTTIMTRFDTNHPRSPVSATMMLDDSGHGNVVISGPEGAVFSTRSDNMQSVITVLEDVRRLGMEHFDALIETLRESEQHRQMACGPIGPLPSP